MDRSPAEHDHPGLAAEVLSFTRSEPVVFYTQVGLAR